MPSGCCRAGFRATVVDELPPEVEFLDAGAMADEFSEEAARRTGADVFHPTPAIIGEIFGGARVDLGIEGSIDRATDWAADLVVAAEIAGRPRPATVIAEITNP